MSDARPPAGLIETVRKLVEDERHPMADYVRAELEAALLASSVPPPDAFSVVDAALLAEAKKYEALADQATEPAEVERLERIAREQWAGHDAVRRLWLRASSAPPPDQIEALQGVIGLCESEANRMKHDPKTADHWRQVARALNELHVNLVMDEAQRNVRHIVEREREAENVSGIMDMRLRASSAPSGDAPSEREQAARIADAYANVWAALPDTGEFTVQEAKVLCGREIALAIRNRLRGSAPAAAARGKGFKLTIYDEPPDATQADIAAEYESGPALTPHDHHGPRYCSACLGYQRKVAALKGGPSPARSIRPVLDAIGAWHHSPDPDSHREMTNAIEAYAGGPSPAGDVRRWAIELIAALDEGEHGLMMSPRSWHARSNLRTALTEDPTQPTREYLLHQLELVGISPPEFEGEPWTVTTNEPEACGDGMELEDAIRQTARILSPPSAYLCLTCGADTGDGGSRFCDPTCEANYDAAPAPAAPAPAEPSDDIDTRCPTCGCEQVPHKLIRRLNEMAAELRATAPADDALLLAAQKVVTAFRGKLHLRPISASARDAIKSLAGVLASRAPDAGSADG